MFIVDLDCSYYQDLVPWASMVKLIQTVHIYVKVLHHKRSFYATEISGVWWHGFWKNSHRHTEILLIFVFSSPFYAPVVSIVQLVETVQLYLKPSHHKLCTICAGRGRGFWHRHTNTRKDLLFSVIKFINIFRYSIAV